jgi:hypothetical protein
VTNNNINKPSELDLLIERRIQERDDRAVKLSTLLKSQEQLWWTIAMNLKP